MFNFIFDPSLFLSVDCKPCEDKDHNFLINSCAQHSVFHTVDTKFTTELNNQLDTCSYCETAILCDQKIRGILKHNWLKLLSPLSPGNPILLPGIVKSSHSNVHIQFLIPPKETNCEVSITRSILFFSFYFNTDEKLNPHL